MTVPPTGTAHSKALAVEPKPGRRELSTAKAIQEAISQRMTRDESVFVMGEDVGPYGGGYSDGAQHSQCLWGTFAHLPGMKVVVPSNPYDAKGLMAAAIESDDPVVFMFHDGIMGLGWMAKNKRSIGAVPAEEYIVPIGKAKVAREGTDVTIVTLSLSVQHSLDVAEKLEAEGIISVEVIDLRSLVPLDRDAIVRSVTKTGRLIVVDEDCQSFGLSGEIIAVVAEHDPTLLKSVSRVCVPVMPIPYARELEYAVLPTPARIEAAVREAVPR